MNNVTIAFLITLFAGLATGIGSLIAFLAKSTNRKFLSVSLGFSAGVMIYVSMVEIFVKAKDSLILALGEKQGNYLTVISFFLGIFLIAIIDKFVPSGENPHEFKEILSEADEEAKKNAGLLRMGKFTALAIAIHNFPEGLATFVSALTDMRIAIPIAIAIAIHNIPEGISVSVPIYYATGSKKKAFLYSFLSGMAEPVGALVGYFFLRSIFSDLSFGIIFAMVAGIMVFISLDELLPAAEKYGEHHLSIYGLVLGMIVMAVSLLLFI
ncbi:zinc transporter ZupT [Clostridium sp.]|uniref:zinc transporter ZupT n=1 Tax=Clostridium sp. TaxID=1506 RepID=UPI001D6377EF|nr:zinc transporter ZupT [Clostridium sp.]MBS5939683.1 zinc transporter ZupT [Clostridium sp.]